MIKFRRGQAQFPVEPQLARRAGQKVCPAHHLGNAHQGIIHHHGQLIGKHTVRPPQVKIPAVLRQILGIGAHVAVHKGNGFVRHHHPPGWLAPGGAQNDLFRRQVSAGPGVYHLPIGAVGGIGGVQLAAAAKAGVNQPFAHQLLVIFFIDSAALALVIGAARAALAAAFICGKAEPGKVGFQQISKFARAAHGIQILNAQHNLAAAAFGRKPRQQAAAQVAQVHPPAGAWRIAPDCAAHSSV